jgi:hypothetical protein
MMLPTDFLSQIKEESEIETPTPTPPPRTLRKEKSEKKPISGIVREFIKIYDCSPITSAKILRRDYRHTPHDNNSIDYLREINEHMAIFSRKMVARPPLISIAFSEKRAVIKSRLIWPINDLEIDEHDANLALIDIKVLWDCYDIDNRQLMQQIHVPINSVIGIEESRGSYEFMSPSLSRDPNSQWLLLETLRVEKK